MDVSFKRLNCCFRVLEASACFFDLPYCASQGCIFSFTSYCLLWQTISNPLFFAVHKIIRKLLQTIRKRSLDVETPVMKRFRMVCRGISLLSPVIYRYTHKSFNDLERFSIECRKTKTKPITYQVDYSANLKP